MFRLGNNLRKEFGFSLSELLIVSLIICVMAGFCLFFYQVLRGERYKANKAAEQIIEAIREARMSAWLGVDNLNSRTLDIAKLPLPKGIEFVTNVDSSELPYPMPILAPNEQIIFEPQTARTQERKWGMIIVRDMTTGTTQGIFIPALYGPLQRFVKYRSDTKYRYMTNSVY